ncbi:hypothetical protein [uncultured Methylobacterium sp.]|mgnify:CR=1 FL=1|jgi:hypothetical protein|uniref:hypothetical protein n=1 Tax=uncultured Methylobacterium sp. TaxID=157278 RepID=UPI002628556C|nr:hypothetical protein [uncultured Methylobacterium sp.]
MKLVPVDHDPFADVPAARAPAGGAPRLVPVDHDPFADGGAPSVAADVAQSAGAGLIRGAASLPDMPQNLATLGNAATGWLARQAARAIVYPFGGTVASDRGIDVAKAGGGVPKLQDLPRLGDAALGAFEDATGRLYEPRTTAGKLARGAAEFVPGAGKKAVDLLAFGALPGLASEAAGQASEGTAAEGPARVVAGLLTGAGAAVVRGRTGGNALVREALDGISAEEIDRAGDRIRAALDADGTRLTWGEALNAETGGRAPRVSQLERVVANSDGGGELTNLYAERPGQVERAGRAAFDRVAPANLSPSGIGLDVQAAAQAGLAQTPEGQALAAAREAVGPRVTPLQAGDTIQPALRGVYEARLAARDEQAARDYGAARAAPERIGVDRTVTVERPGEPILQTRDPGPAAAPTFAPDGPPRTADLAPRRPDPVETGTGPAPKSLARFIAENGGIGLERGDVKAAGLDRWRKPGVAKLVREGGKSIDDFWRVKLIEEGYLPPDRDGGMSRNVHDEVLNALQEEAAGRPRFPIYAEQAADARSGFSAQRDAFEASVSRAGNDLEQALTRAGVDPRSVHPDIMDRATAALVRGDATDPLDAFERVVTASGQPPARPGAREIPTTVTEEISAPRFGQVDPQPALDALDRQIRTAKGDVRGALEGIRRDLYEHGVDPTSGVRETDLSVEGLLHARERIDQQIQAALKDADGTKVRDLQIVRSSLDDQLKAAPEVARADANFAAASRPLEPFAGNTPLGRVVAQDDLTGRMAMPAEQVPAALGTPSAAREAAGILPAEARSATEGRIATDILDGVTDAKGNVSADGLRKAMLDREDVLAAYPAVRERLAGLLTSRENMARVEASPLGRLALQTPDGRKAAAVLFPTNPLPNSAGEVGSAVAALARHNPRSARDLVRLHAESVFNEATQELRGQPAQYGGAGFASALRGNTQQGANLQAAVRALPDGNTIWAGFNRFLDTMEATGWRPQKGSDTAFNQAIQARLKTGQGTVGQAITDTALNTAAGGAAGGAGGAGAGFALGLKKGVGAAWTEHRMASETAAIARLLTDPAALPDLRALVASPPGSPNAAYFTRRLSTIANAAHEASERKAEAKR